MGRRRTTTVDPPFVTSDGLYDATPIRKLGHVLTTDDWLPIAQHFPLVIDHPGHGRILDGLAAAGLDPEAVIARLDDLQVELLRQRAEVLPAARRRDALRSRTLRLSEMRLLDIPTLRARFGTTTNGTYVPDGVPFAETFGRMIGLYLHYVPIAKRGLHAPTYGP